MLPPGIKRLILLMMLFNAGQLHAQDSLPVIYSFSPTIDVLIDDSLITEKFILIPQHRPDVWRLDKFTSAEKITLHTGIDSLDITLRGASQKDFVVILNGKDSCFIRVIAAKKTYFTSAWFAYSLILFALLFLIIYVVFNRWIPLRVQLSTGWIAAVYFWISIFVSGLLQKKYDHVSVRMEELGNMGSGSEFYFAISIFVVMLLVTAFSYTLVRHSKRLNISGAPFLLILSTPVYFFFPLLFPFSYSLKAGSGINVVFILAAECISLFTWMKKPGFRPLRSYTLVCMLFFFLGLLHLHPAFNAYAGILQRCLALSWTLWLFILSSYFLRSEKISPSNRGVRL